ncbi:MAG: penicillin-binding protein 2 [Bdellovibrionales bacterium]|nr:penicillin-binding protein 2 [Bdellovibrionales bacterium]
MSSFVSGSEESTKEFKGRFKVLYLAVIIASSIVLARLWYLQIIQGQELRDYSEKNRVKETKIVAPRGFFLDRNGEVLVQNLPGFSVTISPQYTIKLEQTAEEVGKVLNLPKEEIIKTVKESRYRNGPFRPVPIRENLSLDEVFKLKLIRLKHPGLNIQKNIVRNYPLGANGAQIFGYVGEISKNQIQFLNKKYTDIRFEQGDIIGKSGIEEVWEPSVRGVPGITFVEVDAKGREATTDTPSFLGLKAFKAKPGSNLVLTLDKDIQIAAQTAMNRDDKIGPRIGSLVAIKNNGEILAWVNSPSFDPNEFSTGISNELWEKLINDPFKPLRNKVIQDHYAPGSTFKPIIALAALQEKVITPSTIVYSPGFIKFGRRMYHDHTKHGHGNINVIHAIERSSNVFFYKMGISLGIDKMFEYASAFGIGQKTGINLSNEVPGLMPNSEWKKRQYGEEWQPGENLSNAIGQGFVLTTPLQMALAFNAIGTEGKLYKPFIVKKLTNHNDEIIKEFEPQLARDLSIADENGFKIDKENFKTVKEGMRLVSNGERGTARWYKVPGIEMAGKTGTAQVRSFSADQIYEKCNERSIEERHHGWFIAFAPADYPEITVAVLAEHACAGSSGGAPVARDVIRAYFEKYHPEKLKVKRSSI